MFSRLAAAIGLGNVTVMPASMHVLISSPLK
jgi:hypothetical protein